ncbi:MAG: Amino-acid acetyltransferase, mitochondrial [Phylliscum demangeonii]|nr:MAG: Amino-acid acetyltransferase, mitochondrial [Phylliscum demangeonii]
MPSEDNSGGAHVFINLEQEFHMIEGKILDGLAAGEYGKKHLFDARVAAALPSTTAPHSGSSTQAAALLDQKTMLKEQASHDDQSRLSASHVHLDNLRLMQRALALLPPSSSGLVTTPQAAANTEETSNMTGIASGVGTRQQRNALIHNLLTDKPEYSSSLPAGRLGLTVGNQATMKGPGEGLPSTFIKRGMPLTIIPDPREHPWRAPGPTDASLSLHDPRIDLSRLVDLIEDSFNRKLDLQHYLARVSGQIAGIIVAGEYEGGALLTWELPPGASIEPADAAASRHRLVPYLDKFAVRKRSQGAGGVADIVFTAMGNPVNKWYFERAKGTWKLPDTPWSMFWTTDHLLDDGGRGGEVFEDYVAVCRTIEPSWADHKDVVD